MTTIASSLCRRFSWRSLLHDFRTTRCRRSHGSVSGDHIGDPLLGEQTAGDALPDDAGFPGDPIVLDPEIKRRPVPTTGSTMLAFSPGVTVAVRENLRAYFFVQVPLVRDFNNNLVPDVGYLARLSMSF